MNSSFISLLVQLFLWVISLFQVENKIEPRGSFVPKIDSVVMVTPDTFDIVETFMQSDYLVQIMYRESRGDSTVISYANCMGLYQIHPLYFNQMDIDCFSYVSSGRFTMPVTLQKQVCKHFIREQIKFFQANRIPITHHNIFMSWYGTSFHLFTY